MSDDTTTYTCPGCGDEYQIPGDAHTHFSVSQHRQEAVDFAVDVCPDCASEVVNKLAGWKHERDRQEAEA